LVAVVAAFLALPALAGASYSMNWAKAAQLVNPNKGYQLDSVACAPSVTSTAATAGVTTGTVTPVGGGTVVNTTLLCLAGDNLGGVWASVHPGRGASSWHRERVDGAAGGIAITGIACPALDLCVAVDSHGQVMHSTAPGLDAKDWTRPTRVDASTQPGGGYVGFSAIACPSTKLCVAVDNDVNGQIAYTSNPAGPAKDWKLVSLGQSVTLDAVACASVNLCIVGGSERLYSTDPTGPAAAWTVDGTLAGTSSNVASFSCPSPKLCLGVGYGDAGTGLSAGTSTLSAAGGTWTEAYVGTDPPQPSAGLVDAVSCPRTNFCVAVDGASNAYTTGTPVRGGWSAATALKPDSVATFSAVSCNRILCVEVDSRGTASYGVVKGASSSTGTTKTTSTGTTTTSTSTSTGTTKTTTTTTKTK
jgi:hypothetical protein